MPEMHYVDSSTMNAIGYEADPLELTIAFKNGSIYVYSGVSQEVFDQFLGSDSKGQFFNQNIKNVYPFRRE